MSRRAVLAWAAALMLLTRAAGVAQDERPWAPVEDHRFGHFVSAAAISTDPFGNVYVTDAGAHTVSKFDSTGRPLRTVGGQGWGADQFDHPGGIDARLGVSIYMADTWNHRIVHFDRDLNTVATFSTRSDPDQSLTFGLPMDVTNSRSGTFAIVDGENHRIALGVSFTRIASVFGGNDAGAGRLEAPLAIAAGADDRLYVLEQNRVVEYDAFGNFHRAFGMDEVRLARGVFVDAGGVHVVMPDMVAYFDLTGAFHHAVSRAMITFAEQPGEFRDMVVLNGRTLLLTETCVVVLEKP